MHVLSNMSKAVVLAVASTILVFVNLNEPLSPPKAIGSVLAPSVSDTHSVAKAHVQEAYGKLPLSFEANAGQTDPRVKFLSRGSGYSLFLTESEAVLALTKKDNAAGPAQAAQAKLTAITAAPSQKSTSAVLRMKLVGARPPAKVTGQEGLAGKVNYFIGNDPAKWRTDVPTYGKVRYERVYPGIDLVYYGNQRQLEYDFVVAPGADPARIRLGFDGAQKIHVDAQGGLVVQTGSGAVRWQKPVVYQETNGVRKTIEGKYLLRRGHQVSFEVAAYDSTKPLIIDPTLVYSTYLGGSGSEIGVGIAVDSLGNAYVTGNTTSSNFPTAVALQPATGGGRDAFVTKLNAAGTTLLYSTYLGGSDSDQGNSIAVDSTDNVYVTGETSSTNFPTTAGAFQMTNAGGIADAFVTKLNPTGTSLLYSTYLGGTGDDSGFGIAVDSTGNAYVTGHTTSTTRFFPTAGFPTTPGAFQTTNAGNYDAFVTKLDTNALGSLSLVYSTYLGSIDSDTGNGIAVDSTGNAYVTGATASANFPIPTTAGTFQTTLGGSAGVPDAFVTKLNPTGTALLYSSYLGGSETDVGNGIAVDSTGNAYVTGFTYSTNFPTTTGAFQTVNPGPAGGKADAFVTKLNTNASGFASLVYSTYLGGTSFFDGGNGMAVDSTGNAYVTGLTYSTDFPTTTGAFQTVNNGNGDVFITKLNTTGTAPLLYSTYLGGNNTDYGQGIAVDSTGNAYVTGVTSSADFPTTAGAFQGTYAGGGADAFIAKLTPVGTGGPGAPATLTLSPSTATNTVSTQHCVTATVKDASGNPTPGITVRFSVTGSVTTSGSGTTDANGQATFCYTGPASPGNDAITAYADTDNSNTQDAGEPSGAAAKMWTAAQIGPPTSEDQCKKGGWMTFNTPRTFKNQGDCMQYVNTGK
jgi:hypothetical protein